VFPQEKTLWILLLHRSPQTQTLSFDLGQKQEQSPQTQQWLATQED
jgi:hypothetical protein